MILIENDSRIDLFYFYRFEIVVKELNHDSVFFFFLSKFSDGNFTINVLVVPHSSLGWRFFMSTFRMSTLYQHLEFCPVLRIWVGNETCRPSGVPLLPLSTDICQKRLRDYFSTGFSGSCHHSDVGDDVCTLGGDREGRNVVL